MADIGAKIAIDGEKKFRQELANITQAGKTLSAEMNELTSSFDKADASEKDMTKVSENLNAQIENQRKLVAKLQEAVERSTAKTGENSTETLKWKEKLAKAGTSLHDLERQSKDSADGVEELSNAEADATKQTSVFGDVLKANLASELIKKGIEATLQAVKNVAKYFADAVESAAKYADEINTLAKTTGLSTDAIQEYKYASDLLDVSFETIEGSLTKLVKNMDSARDGSGSAAEAFEALGVAVTDENGNLRQSTEVFDDVITALGKVENTSERDAQAMAIFGKSARDLNPLIIAGADAMGDLRKEAHQVGAVLDTETLDGLSEVKDGFDRLKQSFDALKKRLGSKLGAKILPELEQIVKVFQKLSAGDTNGFVEGALKSLDKLAQMLPRKLGTLLSKLPKLLSKLSDSRLWSSVAKAIGEGLGQILGNAPAIIAAGVKLGAALVKGVLKSIPSIFTGIVKAFRDSRMSDATRDAVEGFRELRDAIADIPTASDRMNDSLGEIEARRREAEKWVEIFDELSAKTNPTAQDTMKLEEAVKHLNELYPELGLTFDKETGKWSATTEEIRKSIAAMTEYYRAQAYYQAASETLTDIARLELEREKIAGQIDGIQRELGAWTQTRDRLQAEHDALKPLVDAWGAGAITAEQFAEATKGMFPDGTVENLSDARGYLLDITTRLSTAKKNVDGLSDAFDEGKDAIDDYDAKINSLQGDVDFLFSKGDEWQEAAYKNGYKSGTSLTAGAADGVRATAQNLANAAVAAMRRAIAAMNKEAQIQSPSKVTEKIGEYLGLGLIKGFDETLDPSAFSLSGTFDAMRGSAVNNNSVTSVGDVTIYVNARDGMNVADLADEIAYKFQDMVTQRRAVFSNELHV